MSSQAIQFNFAPATPLIELPRNKNASEKSTIVKMIQEFHQEITNRNLKERREIAETGRLMANVRSGKLVMKRDPIYGGLALVKPLPHKPRQDQHVYPLAQVNSSQLTSIWTLSRPKAVPRHFGNTNTAQIQHALIEQVISYYDVEHFDELFHQRESLSMMDYGTAIIRTYYDPTLNAIKQLQPILQHTPTTLMDGYGACLSCGYEGTDTDFSQVMGMNQCPDCQSTNTTDMVSPQTAPVAQVVRAQEVSQGDIGCDLLPIPACNWDMRKLVQESSFFQYRSEVPLRVVQSILGESITENGPGDDVGLGVMNALGTRGGAAEGWGRENTLGNAAHNVRSTIMDEEWYDPEWYTGVVLQKEEKTVSGEMIPAGVPLEKIFPDGLCVVGFNNMEVLAGIFNEKRRIVSGVYHLQSFSGVGKGTTDAVEISEQLHSAHSANLAVIKRYGAGGGFWYDKDVMSKAEAKALLKPGALVGVSMRGTGYNSVENALRRIETGELSQSNLAMVAQLANLMNISFQTTDFTSGVANDRVNINTASGQQMLSAQNEQRSAAPLRMKGYMRARIFEHVIALFRENMQLPKYFGQADRFSLTRGRYISADDIPEKVKCDFVQDSEQPTNTYTKRENASKMLEQSKFLGIPFVQLAEQYPRWAMWYADQFQADIPMFNQNEVLIVCQDRLDNLKELAEESDQMSQLSGFAPPPEEIVSTMLQSLRRPVFTDEDNHTVKAQVLSEYLDDDEVMKWSPTLRAAVEALIQKHYTCARDAKYFQLGLDNQGQIGLMAQQQQAQQQMQAPMMQAQQQAQQEQGQQQMQAEAAHRMGDLVAAEEQHQREQEAANADFQRQQVAANADFQRQRASQADLREQADSTVNYTAAPPDVQRQMEADAGYKPSKLPPPPSKTGINPNKKK